MSDDKYLTDADFEDPIFPEERKVYINDPDLPHVSGYIIHKDGWKTAFHTPRDGRSDFNDVAKELGHTIDIHRYEYTDADFEEGVLREQEERGPATILPMPRR